MYFGVRIIKDIIGCPIGMGMNDQTAMFMNQFAIFFEGKFDLLGMIQQKLFINIVNQIILTIWIIWIFNTKENIKTYLIAFSLGSFISPGKKLYLLLPA